MYSDAELKYVVSEEGLSYALRDYGISSDEISDKETSELWKKAYDALDKLVVKLFKE